MLILAGFDIRSGSSRKPSSNDWVRLALTTQRIEGRRTVGRLCSTAPRKCKNRYHEKPLYMTQIILKDYIIMNIGDFKPLVSYFMPIIGPKVTKVGPKSRLKRPIYV